MTTREGQTIIENRQENNQDLMGGQIMAGSTTKPKAGKKARKKTELSGCLASTSDEVKEFLYEEPTTVFWKAGLLLMPCTYTRLYNNQTEQN